MRIDTRFDVDDTICFIYGNEFRSAKVCSIITKKEKELVILYGYEVSAVEQHVPVVQVQYVDSRDAFKNIDKLVEAHTKRYQERDNSLIEEFLNPIINRDSEIPN